jgi:hypothetical protein
MLTLVHSMRAKRKVQSALEMSLKAALKCEGIKRISYSGGNFDEIVYSAGKGKLWCAFNPPSQDSGVPRYWNGLGIYNPEMAALTPVAEINIPAFSNSAQAAGFFAEDGATGDIFLMHGGRIGGGRPGIGKSTFLMWSNAELVGVSGEGGDVRSGIAIGNLGSSDLPDRIWQFVRTVHRFIDPARVILNQAA